jgi:hypothetical protein
MPRWREVAIGQKQRLKGLPGSEDPDRCRVNQ